MNESKMNEFQRLQYKKAWNKRFVNFKKGKDHEMMLLAAMGRSNRCIMGKTPLTNCQVSYRAMLLKKKFGISRMDIRNGEGPLANFVFHQVREALDAKVMSFLEKNL